MKGADSFWVISWGTVGRSPTLADPQFPHLSNGESDLPEQPFQ